jgi:hypothetical protein
MKVLDLACQYAHSFEGWFGSEEDFQSQLARGLVQCPICDDAKITKKLSAPRLNLSGAKEAALNAAPSTQSPVPDATNSIALCADSTKAGEPNEAKTSVKHVDAEHPLHALMRNPEFQAAYMQMAKDVLAKTEDVGTDFAREARKIHYGESKERGIRGQASHDETMELHDEGIEVMPLLLPNALKGTLQ